jgi:putative oxidoreductase
MEQSHTKGNIYLQIGGVFSFAFAVFQISAILWSQELLTYFGGPVKIQAENPILYILVCLVVGALVALFGLYAFSGAGKFRRLPLLRSILVTITAIFILRGFAVINDLMTIHKHPELDLIRFLVFSIIALVIGLIHLLGVIRLFKYGRPEKLKSE